MIRNVSEFTSLFKGPVHLAYFRVTMGNPFDSSADSQLSFLAHSTSALPASAITSMDYDYFGRKVHYPGVKNLGAAATRILTINVYEDETLIVRRAMENWVETLNSSQDNIRSVNASETSQYKTAAEVLLYHPDGSPLRTYTFYGVYPSAITQPLDGKLEWVGGGTETSSCAVTLNYDYYLINPTIGGV